MGLCQWRLESGGVSSASGGTWRYTAAARGDGLCRWSGEARRVECKRRTWRRSMWSTSGACHGVAAASPCRLNHPRQIPQSQVASCGAPDRQPPPRPPRARHATLASTSRPLPARAALTSASMPSSVAPLCCVAPSSPAAARFRRGGRRAPVASRPFAGRRML